jgi:anhydro-N-acetylmuramic acid kinase
METKMPTPDQMLVAGVMSGTSADGIDVALCDIGPGATAPIVQLIRHREFPYPDDVRAAVLAAMSSTDAPAIAVADLARLNWRLGELYADAVQQTCAEAERKPALIGMHGQTLYHQAAAAPYLGAEVRSTWQTGEPAILRERLGVPVVSDFRPADLAAGGQGAPLVPMLDYTVFRSQTANRLLLNLGGIANLTVLPAACRMQDVLAFDTGPGNMVLDAVAHATLGVPFDRNGEHAAGGNVMPALLAPLLRHPYFAMLPPKSCGREQFGTAFVRDLLHQVPSGSTPQDVLATAAELTVRTIANAIRSVCMPRLKPVQTELVVGGGGVRNLHLMHRLTAELAPSGITVRPTDDLGMAAQAKEAAAFALLAWLTWNRQPGNLPSATGAAHPAILGKVCL